MNRLRNLGITAKLTIVFVLFAAALVAGVGGLAFNSGRAALQAATISELRSTAIEKEAALNNWVSERLSNVSALAASPRLLAEVEALAGAEPSLRQVAHDRLVDELRARTGPGQPFLALLVLAPDTGQVIAATDPSEEGKFKEDRPYFVQGREGPYAQNVYYSLRFLGPAMTVSAPLRAADGQLLGVLAGRLNLDEMNAIVRPRSSLRQTDDAYLANPSSMFVTQPRFISDPAVLRRGVHTEAVKACLAGAGDVVFAPDYRDIPAIIVNRWLPERQVCLIVKVDRAEALAPSRAFGRTVGLIGGLALLVASALAVGLARTITRPVLALQAGASRLGRGELHVRLPETSGDELGLLAREFNVMAAALAGKEAELRRYTHDLEQRVEARTRALQDSEATFRLLFASHPHPMWVYDLDTLAFLEVNDAAVDHYGYSRAEFLAMRITDIRPPEDVPRLLEDVQQERPVLQHSGHWRHRLKDGRVIDVEITSHTLEFAGRSAALVVALDITERLRAESALRESEARYRLLIETMNDGLSILDASGVLTYANDRLCQMVGYSRPELIGKPAVSLVAETHRKTVSEQVSRHRQHEYEPYEVVMNGRDGQQISAIISPAPIIDGDGHFQGSVAVITDITRQKQTEAALARSLQGEKAAREQLAFLAEASRVLASSLDYTTTLAAVARLAVPEIADWCAVDVLDADGVVERLAVVHTDPAKIELAFELQRRYPTDPESGTGIYQVLRTGQPDFYPEIPSALLAASAQDKEHLALMRELGLVSAMVVPLVAHERTLGAITLVSAESGQHFTEADLALAEDLARRAALAVDNARLYREAQELNVELEARVEERTARLEAANRELEAFSYSVSHDLRAPLRAIDGFSRILLEDYAPQLSDDVQRYLGIVRNNTQQMGRLIDDLLTFSRLSRKPLQMEPLDSTRLVRQVLAELEAERSGRQIELRLDELPPCKGDAALLKQVWLNLLSNAIKYTRRREVAVIEIGSVEEEGQQVYLIKDNGVGFDMRYSHKLFNVFQRLHRAEEYEGTGVGLAIVQRIVHRHGGRVWAEAEVDQGATFYFTLRSGSDPEPDWLTTDDENVEKAS